MNLETMLTERVGAVGGKLHTGRSRNDQVATDLRLWTRRAIGRLDAGIVGLEQALVDLAEREGDAVLPGTTHIQPAQPVAPRPPPARLRRDAGAGPRPAGRRPPARSTSRRSGAGALAGAGYPAGPGDDGRGAGLRRRDRELARRGRGPRLRGRGAGGRGPGDGPPLAPGRGDHLVVEPAVRVRARRRRVLHRLLDDAQQEEPGPGRARPRADGRRHRRAGRRC